MIRRVMLIRHISRAQAIEAAEQAEAELKRRGIQIVEQECSEPVDLIMVLGGDGTILAASEQARRLDVPLIGINTGHMGFLAEAEQDGIPEVISRLAAGDYAVEKRMTIDITIRHNDGRLEHNWALNEAAIMRTDMAHPARLGLGVDGQGVSTYGADGILLATPTGSTAYSFSAGGPVVWPDVEALVVAPLAAHGLFTTPLVVGPSSELEVSVLPNQWRDLQVWCDGLRCITVGSGSLVTARKGQRPVMLAHIADTPFSGRLVAKFDLPVAGWHSVWGDK